MNYWEEHVSPGEVRAMAERLDREGWIIKGVYALPPTVIHILAKHGTRTQPSWRDPNTTTNDTPYSTHDTPTPDFDIVRDVIKRARPLLDILQNLLEDRTHP